MTDQQELDLNELNEALQNIDNGEDDPPKKDNKGEPEQNQQSKETTNEETKHEKSDKKLVDIDTVYQLIQKMNDDNSSSSGTKKQQKQRKQKTPKQQQQFQEMQRKREEKREQERKEREKQKLLQEIDIDGLVNQKLERILSQYEHEQHPQTASQYQPSTVEPQAAPVDEKPAYPYNHLTTKPEKPSKPPSLFNQLGLNTSTPQKSRQPKQPAVKENPQSRVNPFNFFKKA
jgi:hypothetical protein